MWFTLFIVLITAYQVTPFAVSTDVIAKALKIKYLIIIDPLLHFSLSKRLHDAQNNVHAMRNT